LVGSQAFNPSSAKPHLQQNLFPDCPAVANDMASSDVIA
jgi:hypothetical protein